MEKTILIACPTCGLDPDPGRWLDTLLKIQNQIRALGIGQAFLAPYRMSWDKANNLIWANAFKYDFDYILRIDDDIHGAPDDAIQKLITSGKDVIGAAYRSRHLPHVWCALNRTPEAAYKRITEIAKAQVPLLAQVQETTGVHRVDQIGFGMTLIRVAAFKDFQDFIFEGCDEDVPDDTVFADICEAAGIQQFVHMDVKLWHRDISPNLTLVDKKG